MPGLLYEADYRERQRAELRFTDYRNTLINAFSVSHDSCTVAYFHVIQICIILPKSPPTVLDTPLYKYITVQHCVYCRYMEDCLPGLSSAERHVEGLLWSNEFCLNGLNTAQLASGEAKLFRCRGLSPGSRSPRVLCPLLQFVWVSLFSLVLCHFECIQSIMLFSPVRFLVQLHIQATLNVPHVYEQNIITIITNTI